MVNFAAARRASIGAILMSASWKPGIAFLDRSARRSNCRTWCATRSSSLALRSLSLKLTPRPCARRTASPGGRSLEVAKLFAGIFICIMPVIAMLQAGSDGRLRAAGRARHRCRRPAEQRRLFLADRRAVVLPRQRADLPRVLRTGRRRSAASDDASSRRRWRRSRLGAVFMGANTYIGNAPNFMVYAIARRQGREDAELLRLHALVRAGADPGVYPAELAVLWLRISRRRHSGARPKDRRAAASTATVSRLRPFSTKATRSATGSTASTRCSTRMVVTPMRLAVRSPIRGSSGDHRRHQAFGRLVQQQHLAARCTARGPWPASAARRRYRCRSAASSRSLSSGKQVQHVLRAPVARSRASSGRSRDSPRRSVRRTAAGPAAHSRCRGAAPRCGGRPVRSLPSSSDRAGARPARGP